MASLWGVLGRLSTLAKARIKRASSRILLPTVGSHAMKSVESTSLTIKRAEPPACDLCEGFVTSMSKFLADPKTEHDVEQVLENVLCKSLPAEFYDTCVQVCFFLGCVGAG